MERVDVLALIMTGLIVVMPNDLSWGAFIFGAFCFAFGLMFETWRAERFGKNTA